MYGETHYRVYQITEELRDSIKATRGDKALKLFLTQAIETEIPQIIADLAKIGFETEPQGTRPARYPLTEDSLARLQTASEVIGLPQNLLLVLALKRVTEKATESPKKAPTSKKAPTAAKAKRTQRKATGTPRKTKKGGAR